MGIRGELQESIFRIIWVNFDRGNRNLVQVSGEFELSEFELSE